MRETAPGWYDAINAGKESVLCDLPDEVELLRGLLARADVVLDTFRPGVLTRLGVRPQDLPERVVACSITGFGTGGTPRAAGGTRHQLPGLGGRAARHRAGMAARCRSPISPPARSAR